MHVYMCVYDEVVLTKNFLNNKKSKFLIVLVICYYIMNYSLNQLIETINIYYFRIQRVRNLGAVQLGGSDDGTLRSLQLGGRLGLYSFEDLTRTGEFSSKIVHSTSLLSGEGLSSSLAVGRMLYFSPFGHFHWYECIIISFIYNS